MYFVVYLDARGGWYTESAVSLRSAVIVAGSLPAQYTPSHIVGRGAVFNLDGTRREPGR